MRKSTDLKKPAFFFEIATPSTDVFPLVPTTFGQNPAQHPEDRPGGFQWNQFIWVTEGEGVFSVGGETVLLTAGHGLFTRLFVPHAYHSAGESFETAWMTFAGGEALLDYYGVGDYFFFEAPDFLTESSRDLARYCSGTFRPSLRSSHAYSFVTELLDTLFQREPSFSERVTQLLELKYDQPLSLEDVAEAIGCNRFYLCKNFRQDTGKTVMRCLREIRLRHAKEYLAYSTYTISEIGQLCGFDSDSYFIKIFHEELGMTPHQYRSGK